MGVWEQNNLLQVWPIRWRRVSHFSGSLDCSATLSACLRLFAYGFLLPYVIARTSTSNFGKAGSGGFVRTPDLSYWPHATLWRYLQLAGAKCGTEQGSELGLSPQKRSIFLKHMNDDPYCCCELESCSGSLPAEVGRLQVAFTTGGIALGLFHDVAVMYTTLVTFASSLWNGWTVLLGLAASW